MKNKVIDCGNINSLIIRNFNLNLKDKTVRNIIQKELCLLYDSNYRKNIRPKYKLIRTLSHCQKYKKDALPYYASFIKLHEIKTILYKLGCDCIIIHDIYKHSCNHDYIFNLTSYENVCTECKGTGDFYRKSKNTTYIRICNKCNHHGYIDWIDGIKR